MPQKGSGKAYLLDHTDVVNRICANLVAAGVLLQSEIPRYSAQLDRYTQERILQVLVYSHQLKEAAKSV